MKKNKKMICIVSAVVLVAIIVVCTIFICNYNNAKKVEYYRDLEFSWDNASVYFLLTDRFYNGNTSNDHSYGRGLDENGKEVEFDQSGAFQGGDFQGVTDKINDGYFNELGINAIWLSAPYEQIHGYIVAGDGESFPHYGYHGYYTLDFTETDANFGTKEEFRTLVDTAHEHGIRIVMDIVMNHVGYNSIKDMQEYNFGAIKEGGLDYYYSHQNVNNQQYHGYIDYSTSDWDNWWGGDWIRAGLPNYDAGGTDDYTMCLAGLPDLKTESDEQVSIPKVLETKWKAEGTYDSKVEMYGEYNTVDGYMISWLSEWVREFGVDGFRCDTAKHVELEDWKKLSEECDIALQDWKRENPSKALDDADFWMTGEAFGHMLYESRYFKDGGFESMINFEFAPSTGFSKVPDRAMVQNFYPRYAEKINSNDSMNVLTYISSHDTIMARGDRIDAGSFLLMLPGGVQIFYGDESEREKLDTPKGASAGAGHQLRSYMNWDSMEKDTLEHWQKVGSFRARHQAVGAGSHEDISLYDENTGYTFSRTKDGDSIVATLFAKPNSKITIDVSSVWQDGVSLKNAYSNATCTVKNGEVTFDSSDTGTILLEIE